MTRKTLTLLHVLIALMAWWSIATASAVEDRKCPKFYDWPWETDQKKVRDALKALAQGDRAKALAFAGAITTPENLIAMAADKRFDTLAPELPRLNDISGASIEVLFQLRSRALACPHSMRAQSHWQTELLDLGRFKDALRIAQNVDLTMQQRGRNAYEDAATMYSSILIRASRAFIGLGLPDQAVRASESSLRSTNMDAENIPQRINFARLLTVLERTGDAKDQLGKVSEVYLNQTGIAVVRLATLDSALQSHDTASQQVLLDYLELHKKSQAVYYQCALIGTNRLDAAADWLIERLSDPDLRSDALLRLQEFSSYGAKTSWSASLTQRWEQMLGRPDVLAAVDKVGRIGRYGFMWRPNWQCEWPR